MITLKLHGYSAHVLHNCHTVWAPGESVSIAKSVKDEGYYPA